MKADVAHQAGHKERGPARAVSPHIYKKTYFVPNALSWSNSQYVTINFRILNLDTCRFWKTTGYKRWLQGSLLKELVNGCDSLKADAISFSNHCFIILVLTWHYLLTQNAQLCEFCLQLSSQVLYFSFGARNEVLLFLDALLSRPDLGLEVF
jgi:hypothetical protein